MLNSIVKELFDPDEIGTARQFGLLRQRPILPIHRPPAPWGIYLAEQFL